MALERRDKFKKGIIMIKKIIMCIVVFYSSIQCFIPWETGPKATNGQPWNFELSNKSDGKITVSLQIFRGAEQKTINLARGDKLRAVIPTDHLLHLGISSQILIKEQHGGYPVERQFTIKHPFTISLCPGGRPCQKTAFLTFDNNGLRLQRGLLRGLLGQTESGLTMNNYESLSPDWFTKGRPISK